MNLVLRHVRRVAYLHDQDCLTDGQLLEQFVSERVEAAFEALLRRHGPMVLGVCRRVLHNDADAEDAFQATFLVMVRKGGSVQPRELVGHWLYGVAYRTAIRAKTLEAKRRMKEKAVPRPEVQEDGLWQDVLPLLDQELSGLPEKYRLPVVLCDLEGRSRKDVARALGCREGTLSSRLARARTLLARRLSRRGVALSGGALVSLVAANGTWASVPASLVRSTLNAALPLAAGRAAAAACVSINVATLTEGVLKSMLLAKLKTTTLFLCGVAVLGMGTGGLMYQARGGASNSNKVNPTQAQVRASLVINNAEGDAADDRQKLTNEEDSRRALDVARDKERSLREELEQARHLIEKYKQEANVQRDRAEAERNRAEAAQREAEKRMARAEEAERLSRRDAAKTQYAAAVQQAAREFGNVPRSQRPEDAVVAKKLLDDLEATVANLLKNRDELIGDFKQREQALQNQLRNLTKDYEERVQQVESSLQRLDEQRQKIAADFERRRGDPQAKQKEVTAKRTNDRASPAVDKLDRVLERLERMEQRLDRIERSKR